MVSTRTRRRISSAALPAGFPASLFSLSFSPFPALPSSVVSRASRFKAHDELGCQMGDTVRIVESKPISKEVRWVVEEIVTRGYHVVLPDDSAITASPSAAAPSAPEGGAA